MALTRTLIGKHETTGEPLWHYLNDDPAKSVVLTGPATGDITLADGTTYAVDPVAIEVDPAHLEELHHHIDLQHEQTGALDVVDDEGNLHVFKHQRCPACKKEGK